jgi:hypothetical protein
MVRIRVALARFNSMETNVLFNAKILMPLQSKPPRIVQLPLVNAFSIEILYLIETATVQSSSTVLKVKRSFTRLMVLSRTDSALPLIQHALAIAKLACLTTLQSARVAWTKWARDSS